MVIIARTLFNGKVALPDKLINKVKASGKSLVIKRSDGVMVIPNRYIDEKVVATSRDAIEDRYGGASYYLNYFVWEPQYKQPLLV